MATSTTIANGPLTAAASGGGGTWGSITGTLSDQPDLNTALGLKAVDTAVAHNTGTENIGGAKTFTSDVVCGSGTASTTTTTGALQVTGGIGATGALNFAGTFRSTNATDSTSTATGGGIFSGGVAIVKRLNVGSTLTVFSANLLFDTTGNVGRDTGVSGSLTDCPANVYTNTIYVKSDISLGANSATVASSLHVEGGTSYSWKSGGNTYALYSTDYATIRLPRGGIALGSGENTAYLVPVTVNTTDATPTVLYSKDISAFNNFMHSLSMWVIGRRNDVTGSYIDGWRRFTFSKDGGGNVILQNSATIGTDFDTSSGCTITADVASNTTARVLVTGKAAQQWHWAGTPILTLIS